MSRSNLKTRGRASDTLPLPVERQRPARAGREGAEGARTPGAGAGQPPGPQQPSPATPGGAGTAAAANRLLSNETDTTDKRFQSGEK